MSICEHLPPSFYIEDLLVVFLVTEKLEKDLLVLKDGGRVERTIDLNIEGMDNLNEQVRYMPRPDDPHNLLELIEIGQIGRASCRERV